jgi:ABC-type nitrate/sulfonate/bicarbonate transport system ATPase subunit
MQMANETLVVENIYKTFDDEKVLDGITFDVKTGEFVVMVGPNACGKTTLLRIIAGLLPNDYGEVKFPQNENTCSGLNIIFQKPLLLPWLTVEENIFLPLKLKKERVSNVEAFDQLLRTLDLHNRRSAYPRTLSGGEAQKVAIARALVTDPHILLLDEPFSALDDAMRTRLQLNLLKIRSQTVQTILLVTHDLDEAVLLADRIVVLSAKPTQKKAEITINLNRPRERNEQNFEASVLEVRRALLG